MRNRLAPAAATWLLRRFCSTPEHESVTGDLLEQYQNGRGWLWYWRQVLALVLLELYRKVQRRPLVRKHDLIVLGPIPVDKFITAAPLHVSESSGHYQAKREAPMHVHRGINSANIAGEGFEGLPGLLIMLFFVFAFVSLFVPRNNDWFLVLFLVVAIGAVVLYILGNRRDKKDAAQLRETLHQINTPQDR